MTADTSEYSDSDPEIITPRATRFGRQTKKPRLFGQPNSQVVEVDANEEDPDFDVNQVEADQEFVPGLESAKKRRQITRMRPLSYEEYLQKVVPSDIINSNLFCTVCTLSDDKPGNNIVLCDMCDSSFHQHCHSPLVDDAFVEAKSIPWFCYRCSSSEKAIEMQKTVVVEIEEFKKRKQAEAEKQALLELQAAEAKAALEAQLQENPNAVVPEVPQEPVKRKRGRPRKNFFVPVEAPEPEPVEPAERCLSCGLAKEEPEADAEVKPEFSRPSQPENADQVASVLVEKLCKNCSDVFGKHHSFLKQQSPEVLAALLTQTAIRYSQLEDFVRKQEGSSTPFEPQQLLAYSAKTKYIALPTLSAIRVLEGFDAPVVQQIKAKYPNKRPLKYLTARTPSGQRFSSGSFEDMIAKAIVTIGNSRGSKPQEIFQWMMDNIPNLPPTFKSSTTQALKKGTERGRFLKIDEGWYRMNPNFQEDFRSRNSSEFDTPRMSGFPQEAFHMPIPPFPHPHMMMMPYPGHPAFFHHPAAFVHPGQGMEQQQTPSAEIEAAQTEHAQQQHSQVSGNLENVLAFENPAAGNAMF